MLDVSQLSFAGSARLQEKAETESLDQVLPQCVSVCDLGRAEGENFFLTAPGWELLTCCKPGWVCKEAKT